MPRRNYILKCSEEDLNSNERYAETQGEADSKALAHTLRTENPYCYVSWEKISGLTRLRLFVVEKVLRIRD